MNSKVPIFIREDIYGKNDIKKELQKYFGRKCNM